MSKHILVVDDEPGVLRFVKTNLSLSGFQVTTSMSGEEALQIAETQNPDIILLDILMTPMTGFDVLMKLREFSMVPVIVFTARNDIANLARREGANDFIAKPFKPEELLRKINELLPSPA